MAGIFTAAGATKILEPEQTVPFGPVGQESRHFVYPLEQLGVGFSCDIEVLPEASAVILCEGDTVAKSVRAELSYNYKDVEGGVLFRQAEPAEREELFIRGGSVVNTFGYESGKTQRTHRSPVPRACRLRPGKMGE